MAGKGGARPGAGRKPKSERFARPIAAAEKRIADRLPDLVDRLFELAEGVRVQEISLTGAPAVYTRPPDYKAASYLVDRILGKPTQAVEAQVSGPGGGPVQLGITHEEAVKALKGESPAAEVALTPDVDDPRGSLGL